MARMPKRRRPDIQLIRMLSALVPGLIRRDWRDEWEAELDHRASQMEAWKASAPPWFC